MGKAPDKPPRPVDDRPRNGQWDYEPWDKNLPKQKGFLSDLGYHMRGTIVPSAFTAWCGLACLSAAIKREAWLRWGDKRLFTNFYLLLVSPPALWGKDTIIDEITSLLEEFPKYMKNPNLRLMKHLKIIRNESTKQGIIEQLLPKTPGRPLYELDEDGKPIPGKPLIGPDGRPLIYKPTSEAVILAPEVGTLIGKEQYKEGLIQFFLEIYNPKDRRDSGTRSYGLEVLRRLHTVLVGGIQPDVIRDSLPRQASADGFLSRTVIVMEDKVARRRFEPFVPIGSPTDKELAQRLAWIAEHTQGEHYLTDEAKEWVEAYYHRLMDEMDLRPELIGIKGRMQITVRKVALLMKAQRYTTDNAITREDLEDAARLLDATMHKTPTILNTVTQGRQWTHYRTVARYIAKCKKVDRGRLLRNLNLRATELSEVLAELAERGFIKIGLNGHQHDYPSRATKEVYSWTGRESDVPE